MMVMQGDKKILLDSIVEDLKLIEGVKAIVLGGSYAIGTATQNSDLDIGIYYTENAPFDIEKIKNIAVKWAGDEPPTVTGFYEWGKWVNGGAWINTPHGEVDFLYKNIDQVTRTIENAKNGIWEKDYEQQPPYGFSSDIFLAETKYCISLYDPDGIIRTLKSGTDPYPPKLKRSIIQQSLWSGAFTIWQAESFAHKNDLYNTAGCLTRATHNLIAALFALNEIYSMGDKRAIAVLENTKYKPNVLSHSIQAILSCREETLIDNVAALKKLFEEVISLPGIQYTPYYKL